MAGKMAAWMADMKDEMRAVLMVVMKAIWMAEW